MTTRRTRTDAPPNLTDLESASNPVDVPGVMPPPGVQARVRTTVDYDRMVEPEESMSDYGNDLRELAANEIDDDDLPEPSASDPVSEFLSTWQRFTGYHMKVIRLPDPASNLLPGASFNRQCREITMLGTTTFDPLAFEQSLQILSGNSGGVFRVFLLDHNGMAVPGARLDRFVVADPPKQYNPQQPRDMNWEQERYYRREREQQPAPAPPKSETEQYIETMQRELFQKVMMRALDPPTPPPVDPLSSLPTDTRLALGLLEKGDILSNVVDRITSLAQAPERIESSTWKDKLAEAGVNLVTNNPQIITTATELISRTVLAVTQALTPRRDAQIVSEPIPPVQPVRHPQAQRATARIPQPQQEVNTGLPEVPEPSEDDDLEQDEIDMMEEITKLLLSDKPLSFSDPAIVEIRAAYPDMFDKAMQGLGAMPSMVIIQYLCSKSEFCADMFNSPRNGPHLKARLEKLKALIKASGLLPPEAVQTIDAQQETQQAETEPAS